jgi:hypothetical protein
MSETTETAETVETTETAADTGAETTTKVTEKTETADTAQKVEDLPEWAQKQIRDARAEAGNHRAGKNAAEAKQAEILDNIAKALGLKQDEKPDPAKLTEQLTAAQVAQRTAQIELAVHRNAKTHQGDPDALLDSRSFLAKVADLDPGAKDFAAKVDTAIKDAVKDNPKLRAGQTSGSSSVDHSGGPGERRSRESTSLSDAVANHYGT